MPPVYKQITLDILLEWEKIKSNAIFTILLSELWMKLVDLISQEYFQEFGGIPQNAV